MSGVSIPTYDAMMNPLLEALRQLGGSGTVYEINNEVLGILQLTDEQMRIIHDPERGTQTEVEYRLAWTRTYLKKYGILENSMRGVWAFTATGRDMLSVDPKQVKRFVKDQFQEHSPSIELREEPDVAATWREQMMDILLQMDPSAFERLVQRMLRESGFTQVEVTGRTGDGGIDGMGILRLGGLLSFHVMFQAKRWQGSIGASVVRDFRGAMVGRADKGLLVTTGSFTKEATKEATRDGAPAIDLVSGEELLDKLKELALGVRIELVQVEKVSVDHQWFLGV